MAAFTVIEHVEVGAGGVAAVTLDDGGSSIPTTYDHLHILCSTRTEEAVYYNTPDVTFNSDSSSGNYSYTTLYSNTSVGVGSLQYSNQNYFDYIIQSAGTSALADTFSNTSIWIPHYSNSANFTQMFSRTAQPNNSTTNAQWILMVTAALWTDTAAITDITITGSSDNAQYSTFTLYGVTGA